MKPLHKIAMVCTTFLLAAATGHVMQNSAQPNLTDGQETAPQPERAAAEPELSPIHLADATLPRTMLGRPSRHNETTASTPLSLPQEDTYARSGFAAPAQALRCAAPQVETAAGPSASVRLTLTAPCLAGQSVMIRHEDLTLPVRLSESGIWSGLIPAMASAAQLTFDLPDGTELTAQQTVTGLTDLNRYVLRTHSTAKLALHGFEYGSRNGAAGDVNPAAPRTADTPLGGWMAIFASADAANQVQIYTAPANLSDIRLEVEATVDAISCGKDLTGETQRLLKGAIEPPEMLSLAMPDCGDGDGAVLMKLPDFPLSVAAN